MLHFFKHCWIWFANILFNILHPHFHVTLAYNFPFLYFSFSGFEIKVGSALESEWHHLGWDRCFGWEGCFYYNIPGPPFLHLESEIDTYLTWGNSGPSAWQRLVLPESSSPCPRCASTHEPTRSRSLFRSCSTSMSFSSSRDSRTRSVSTICSSSFRCSISSTFCCSSACGGQQGLSTHPAALCPALTVPSPGRAHDLPWPFHGGHLFWSSLSPCTCQGTEQIKSPIFPVGAPRPREATCLA